MLVVYMVYFTLRDGATKSGLFCAISYMVERLKLEQEVDVFQSVKHTRINRPMIVSSLVSMACYNDLFSDTDEQFSLLYFTYIFISK